MSTGRLQVKAFRSLRCATGDILALECCPSAASSNKHPGPSIAFAASLWLPKTTPKRGFPGLCLGGQGSSGCYLPRFSDSTRSSPRWLPSETLVKFIPTYGIEKHTLEVCFVSQSVLCCAT
ncbi:hypothetical protein FA13DRAFT_1726783 [Coprinellus micaceus]|uniref:Uncharacterized protein n=1 Tax=Coprinellus micaceus TaxID=71717 RepID=A0A4Y7TVS1_COPMI|nr:hypothetical protein FA13DRAFT_1726783 [Coprinellus micaceus]